jgi:hypothetical protein
MNLWLLKPAAFLPQGSPWDRWDAAQAFVIRAETDQVARKLAAKVAGEEGRDAWLDGELSTCEVLSPSGSTSVILRNYGFER